MPPRSNTAILWASILSFLAWPPWRAFIYRACPRTKGIPSWAQRSASQVPGEDTLDADDEILPVRRDRLEKRVRYCRHIPVQHDLARLIQDAEVHGAGV